MRLPGCQYLGLFGFERTARTEAVQSARHPATCGRRLRRSSPVSRGSGSKTRGWHSSCIIATRRLRVRTVARRRVRAALRSSSAVRLFESAHGLEVVSARRCGKRRNSPATPPPAGAPARGADLSRRRSVGRARVSGGPSRRDRQSRESPADGRAVPACGSRRSPPAARPARPGAAMNTAAQPFEFSTAGYLIRIANQKAGSIGELANGVAECSDASIFHHTFQTLGQHHFLTEGFSNDFAQWVLASANRASWPSSWRPSTSATTCRSRKCAPTSTASSRTTTDAHPAAAQQTALEPFYFCESVEIATPLAERRGHDAGGIPERPRNHQPRVALLPLHRVAAPAPACARTTFRSGSPTIWA